MLNRTGHQENLANKQKGFPFHTDMSADYLGGNIMVRGGKHIQFEVQIIDFSENISPLTSQLNKVYFF